MPPIVPKMATSARAVGAARVAGVGIRRVLAVEHLDAAACDARRSIAADDDRALTWSRRAGEARRDAVGEEQRRRGGAADRGR